MVRQFAFIFAIMLASISLKAQMLRGKIVDTNSQPVPFSTVFVKEVSFGTSANEEGIFELRLSEGEYTCIFQCMGYQTITKKVVVHSVDNPLIVILPAMIYSLQEVVVGGGEDPAYRIMRKVIRKAPLYAGMVKSFNAEVYIRGSLHIKKISSMVKWMAREDLKESNIKEGDTYLEESVNEIEFTAPNLTRQKVKSIHSTFPGGDDNKSSGAIGFISGNIYQPGAFGNARSPLAPGAFNYYKFRYEGVSTHGDVTVDKIKVIPRGDGPQYVSGHLYIIEGLWCIYSLDISINEQLGATIQLSQSFGEVRDGAWLPVNNRYKIDMDLMGNAGGFLYTTSIRYNKLVVNPPDLKAKKPVASTVEKPGSKKAKTDAKAAKLDKKAAELAALDNPTTAESYRLSEINSKKAELLMKDSLRNHHEFIETYKTVFDSNARKTDSAFWNRVRPIPLATNEQISVKAFDSLQYHQTRKKSDSTKAKKPANKMFFNRFLFGGQFEFDSLQNLQFNGLLSPFGISFNVVDGFVYKTGFNYHRKLNEKSAFSAGFKPGYAFSRNKFLWEAGLGYNSKGQLRNSVRVNFGSGSVDFNDTGGAASIENSISSLFFRQNLSRLYQKDYLEIKHSINPIPELKVETAISFSEAAILKNESDFSFFYNDEREYESNVPDSGNYRMQNHRDFLLDIALSYKPMPYYVIKDGVRVPRPGMNMTPTFTLSYRKAIPADGFDTDFDLVTLGVKQLFKTGRESKMEYAVDAGYFLNNKNIYFDDFGHFLTQPLIVGVKNPYPVMQMGDYYRYSTDSYFLEGHLVYTSPHLLLKHLPLIRNRIWNESLTLNYLYVPDFKNCVEFGYGIGNYLYNVGFYAGFEEGTFRMAGLRIALSVFSQREIVIGM
jgi:hypothetical protein